MANPRPIESKNVKYNKNIFITISAAVGHVGHVVHASVAAPYMVYAVSVQCHGIGQATESTQQAKINTKTHHVKVAAPNEIQILIRTVA